MSLLEIENLSLEIGGTPILRDVDLTIEAGEIMGLVGESGSGKSMTALTVMQLLPHAARARGKVVFAGRQGGYGNLVQVAHAHGYVTAYAHLSRIDVKPGQLLEAGDVVGALGSTGRSTGPHLHYEVQRDGERVDPEHFLSLASPADPVH